TAQKHNKNGQFDSLLHWCYTFSRGGKLWQGSTFGEKSWERAGGIKRSPRVRVVVRRLSQVKSSMFVTPMPWASLFGAEATTRLGSAKGRRWLGIERESCRSWSDR